ncbi:hypothetical protein PMAYCL1PPCAC_09059, partial [Pristionchus mayeri]
QMISSVLLQSDFGEHYPEEIDGTLNIQGEIATCCKFNRWGSLVAVGCQIGHVYIVDFLTRGVVKKIPAHVGPVSNLSWSRDGRSILSASVDMTCSVLDVLSGHSTRQLLLFDRIVSAQFNPRDDKQFLVLTLGGRPSLESTSPDVESKQLSISHRRMKDDAVSCVAFDRRGKYVICGTSLGQILVYEVKTQKLKSIVHQSNEWQVNKIVVPRRGCTILTNSQDRAVRRFDLDELVSAGRKGKKVEPVQKLSDIIDRTPWKSVCCSADSEYICGASMEKHQLYIWERSNGSLIKILQIENSHGEVLSDVEWHPNRAIILSVANGTVNVWRKPLADNWMGFAPEFKELDENSKYPEKESEFDEDDEDESEPEEEKREDSDLEIDVVTVKVADQLGCSSDEENNNLPAIPSTKSGPLWFLPTVPVIDNPEYLNPTSQPSAPYADVNFLDQPAGGMPMQYENENDPRRIMKEAPAQSVARKPVTKTCRRMT